MSREKGVARMLQIFARNIAPRHVDATLTLVGDGPDQETFVELARTLGVANRVFFVGEQPLHAIPGYLRHADLFMYASLSETYGQVISEAQWCGLAVIAFADDRGVSQQIQHGRTGILVEPSGDPEIANFCFASAALRLLRHVPERAALSQRGQSDARARARPEHCVERYYETFALAREHCRSSVRPARPHALQALSVARWTSLHMAIAGAGLLRPPATVNRRNCQQPVWERRGSTPARSSSPLSAASAADA
jgi:glycosyltransferase involved in cell wall biosynthesis